MECKNMFPTSFHSFSVIFHLRISFAHKIWSPTLETYEVFEIEKGQWKIEKRNKYNSLCLVDWKVWRLTCKHGSIQIWTLVGGPLWAECHILVPANVNYFCPFQVCGLWNVFWRPLLDNLLFRKIYCEVCASWGQRSSLVPFWTFSRDICDKYHIMVSYASQYFTSLMKGPSIELN